MGHVARDGALRMGHVTRFGRSLGEGIEVAWGCFDAVCGLGAVLVDDFV